MSYQAYPPYNQGPPPGQYGLPPPQGYGAPPPNQGYGAPPPTHSPYPPQGYGALPPPQTYGAPPPHSPYPPQGYGAPPPKELYGSAPPSHSPYPPQGHGGLPPPVPHAARPQGYGALPPPQVYGQPPPQPGYGAPPPNAYGAPPPASYPTPPSPGYGPPQVIAWNASQCADNIRKAMKGFGTDEKALIRELSDKDPYQIHAINDAYRRNHRRDLIKDLKDETSGYLEAGLVGLARGPLLHDVHCLFEGMAGLGTKESVLNDVLLGRSNADLNAIKSAYKHTFHRDLVAAVKGELSLKTERHFEIVLEAHRAEDSAPVIKADIDRDVDALYAATEGKMGTDEMRVCSILSLRNDNQLRAIAHEYKLKYARDLETVIKKEFRGHMEDALLFQLRRAVDKYAHQAQLLEDAMAGMGTKDQLLVARVVRAHWDKQNMTQVKGAYRAKFRGDLSRRIKGETSGDYERLMIACIGER